MRGHQMPELNFSSPIGDCVKPKLQIKPSYKFRTSGLKVPEGLSNRVFVIKVPEVPSLRSLCSWRRGGIVEEASLSTQTSDLAARCVRTVLTKKSKGTPRRDQWSTQTRDETCHNDEVICICRRFKNCRLVHHEHGPVTRTNTEIRDRAPRTVCDTHPSCARLMNFCRFENTMARCECMGFSMFDVSTFVIWIQPMQIRCFIVDGTCMRTSVRTRNSSLSTLLWFLTVSFVFSDNFWNSGRGCLPWQLELCLHNTVCIALSSFFCTS